MTPHFLFLVAVFVFLLIIAACAGPVVAPDDNRMMLEQLGNVRMK